jgi:hypothetical protein
MVVTMINFIINKLVGFSPSFFVLAGAIGVASLAGVGSALTGLYLDPDRRRKAERKQFRRHYH